MGAECRYVVRRTLGVDPGRWGSLAGSEYGGSDSLLVAVRLCGARGRLGYPSRVVDTWTGRCVWVRGRRAS